MRAGKLKEFIVIQSLNVISNEYGEEERSEYCDKIRTRADVVKNGGNRTNENGEIVFDYSKTFIVWDYFDEIVNEHVRIIYERKPYRIITKELDNDNKILYIKTELINE